jgi:apolipoprotein N-acyltransferase
MLTDMLLALFSSLLLILCFPDFDISFLAWIALVPLLIAITVKSLRRSAALSFLCGVVFFTGIFRWILDFPGFTLLHQSMLGIYVGIFFGLFGLAFSFIARKSGLTTALFVAPFLWVPLEYIRSNLFFMALPWGLLAHSQYLYPTVIQIASITGVYGISFLILMVNSALATMILALVCRSRKGKPHFSQTITRRGRTAVMGTAAVLTTLTLFYGQMTVSEQILGKGIKVGVVQGNIEQAKKWDRRYARFIMQTYADLTSKVTADRPALIIWPEAATPRAINQDLRVYSEVRRIAKTAGTHLLLGSSQYQKIKRMDAKHFKYSNSAHLIHPAGKVKNQQYDKIRLMPFGEYLPLEGFIPWSYIKVPDMGSYIPGKEFSVFELPSFRFSVTICWESLFPNLVRRFVMNGAQFLVNITNEAWFGNTAAPYQILSMNVFRSVENRVYMIRSANTGVSCFIDPYGRIVDRVKDEKDQDVFVRGVLTETVIPIDSKTIYTRYGDLLVWLSVLGSAGFLLMAFLRKNPDPHSMSRDI